MSERDGQREMVRERWTERDGQREREREMLVLIKFVK
jgi:hypothetical protein